MIMWLLALALGGFAASRVRFGWLAIPLSLLIPTIPTALGAFDDGESIAIIALWFALWPIAAAIGWVVGIAMRRRSLDTPQAA